MIGKTFLLGLAALAIGCGEGGDEVVPDANAIQIDARVSGDDAAVTDALNVSPERAYAVGTDFATSGIFSAVEINSRAVTTGVVAGVASTDPVLRYYGGKIYIINRFGADNITIINAADNQFISQISTGSGTNPQDVAVKGNKIYVAALKSGNIIILDESNPGGLPQFIDISIYDTDGIPDANSLYLVGDLLFVSLEHLDGSFSSTDGTVLVIDTTTDQVVDTIDLTYNNPFGVFTYNSTTQELLITTTVDFATTGCVQRIQTTAPYTADCLVENSLLGGYAGRIGVDDGQVWLAVQTSWTAAHVIDLDSSGLPNSTPLTPSGQQPTDFAICPSGAIVVNDQTSGGLRIYVDGSETTTSALDIGLPPSFGNGIVCL